MPRRTPPPATPAPTWAVRPCWRAPAAGRPRPAAPPLAAPVRRPRRPRRRGGAGRRPHVGQLLRAHAGGCHARRAVHRCPGRGRPCAHGQDPAHRRLRHPAERTQLPAIPLPRLGQPGDLGGGSARPHDEREPVSRPGVPRNGPGPVVRHRGRAVPPRLLGDVDQRGRAHLRDRGELAGGRVRCTWRR